MEIAIDDRLPTYCGGLGVLAGDHLRAAADLGVPVIGVTLLYRGGYFSQFLSPGGEQLERPVAWSPQEVLEPLGVHVDLHLEGRAVRVTAWSHIITGVSGCRVPVVFLDTDLPDNDDRDRTITDQIYSGDRRHRLRQEAVLGMAGVAILEQLGLSPGSAFHMNEGHSSLLVLSLLRSISGGIAPSATEMAEVRGRCVFTTHTPVPEGHDIFPAELVSQVIGHEALKELADFDLLEDKELNMTTLGMSFSGFVNAVSIRHLEVSRAMFPTFNMTSITNGVHVGRWVAPSIATLFDRHISGWRQNNAILRSASAIPTEEIDLAHRGSKRVLVDLVGQQTGIQLDTSVLTLGIARRAARYKRLDLLLRDPVRLAAIAQEFGQLQIIYAGKAHPSDPEGKAVIVRIHEIAQTLNGELRIVFLENYSLHTASVLCAGSDVWINTPVKGQEASGTSGMKAALNGVPSLSVLDGWWLEGHIEGVTGWSIGDDSKHSDDDTEASDLYEKLETVVGPLFYHHPEQFNALRRETIALNGSYFSAERMVRQYALEAYRLGPALEP